MDMTKPAFKPTRILWLDMEMTGLDPVNDWPIEVGVIVTDWQFKEQATYEGAVHYDEQQLREKFEAAGVFWTENPESRAGLEEASRGGMPLAELENALIAIIDEHCGEGPVLLGGNSIHQDRAFIRQWFPNLERRLHYRMLDVSAWKVVMEGKYGKKFAKPEAHRALEDIRGSIDELKYYLGKVRV